MGVYERNPAHWHMDGAPWDYGMDLIPEEIDRISPELTKALARFPALERAGITFVLAKHENAAGFMAEGVHHRTGAPGILVATIGPGAPPNL